MNYTVNEVNDVRFPGDRFEKMFEQLETLRNNPPVLTDRSRIRKRQTKEFTEKFTPRFRVVSGLQLDTDYAAYLRHDLSFDGMWDSLFCYIFFKAKVETNDFDFKQRGITNDTVQEFMLSMRQGLSSKSFEGKNASTYHNFVNSAWHRHKSGAFTVQKAEDERLISGEAPKNYVDSEGADVEGVSLFDQAVLQDWHSRSQDLRNATLALVEVARLRANETDKSVLAWMAEDVPQNEMAKRLGKSRHAVKRIEARLLAKLIYMHEQAMGVVA